ncbi:hypothetical protein LguiA_000558 [Lonicera macranthoides]
MKEEQEQEQEQNNPNNPIIPVINPLIILTNLFSLQLELLHHVFLSFFLLPHLLTPPQCCLCRVWFDGGNSDSGGFGVGVGGGGAIMGGGAGFC